MGMIKNLTRPITRSLVSGLGGFSSIASFLKFWLNPLTLNDTKGNVHEPNVRNSTAAVFDYLGVLQTVPINTHRIEGGRWDGTAWHNTLPDGVTLLHPHKLVEGISTPWSYPKWAAGTAWTAGAIVFNGTHYYHTVAGGTDTAVFGDVVVWVLDGLYNPRYGLLLEDSATNYAKQSDAFNVAPWSAVNGATSLAGSVTFSTVINSRLLQSGSQIPTGVTTLSVEVRAASARNIRLQLFNATDGVLRSADLPVSTVWKRISFTATTTISNSPISIFNDSAGTPGLVEFRHFNATNEAFASSHIPTTTAPATRATELGNVKWPTANLPTSGKLTWWMGWKPRFASGDLAAANRVILTFNTDFNILWQNSSFSTRLALYDGSNFSFTFLPPWNAYDDIQLVVTADDTTSLMQLHYRNVTQNAPWVHSATAAYDGALVDTGFAQLFKAGGGNNSNVHALMGWGESKTSAWIEANLP